MTNHPDSTTAAERVLPLLSIAPSLAERRAIVDGLAALAAFEHRAHLVSMRCSRIGSSHAGQAGALYGTLNAAIELVKHALICAHVSDALAGVSCHELIGDARQRAEDMAEARKLAAQARAEDTPGVTS